MLWGTTKTDTWMKPSNTGIVQRLHLSPILGQCLNSQSADILPRLPILYVSYNFLRTNFKGGDHAAYTNSAHQRTY